MGKKHKKLKKKKQHFAYTPAINQSASAPAEISDSEELAIHDKPITASTASQITEATPPEFQHVRGDIQRILLLLAIIVLVLIGLYFIDIKTSYLSNTANWFYKILNIQTQ